MRNEPQRDRDWGLALYWLPPLLVVAVARMAAGDPVTLWLGANLLMCAACKAGATVLHELGHAAAARAAGLAVLRIDVGRGPLLRRGFVGRTRWALRSLPFTGLTTMGGFQDQGMRWRLALGYVGGPLANAALLIATHAIVGSQRFKAAAELHQTFTAWAPLSVWVYAQGLTLLVSLIPATEKGRATDMLQLLRAPFYDAARRAQIVQQCHIQAALVALDAADFAVAASHLKTALTAAQAMANVHAASVGTLPQQARLLPVFQALHYMLGTALVHLQDYATARTHLLQAQELLPADSALRGELLNNLAWADVMLFEAALLHEADTSSEAALRAAPTAAHVQGTRGAVLVALGRAAAGLPLLLRSSAAAISASHRAYNLGFIALARHQMGERPAAEAALAEAQRLSPGCDLLPKVAARVRQEPASSQPHAVPQAMVDWPRETGS